MATLIIDGTPRNILLGENTALAKASADSASASATAAQAAVAPLTDTVVLGTSVTPDAGTAQASNGTYFLDQTIQQVIDQGLTVEFYNSAGSGSIKIKFYSVSGGTATVQASLTVAAVAGLNSVSIGAGTLVPLGLDPTWKIAIWTGGTLAVSDSKITYTAGAGTTQTAYWFGTGDLSTISVAGAATTGNRINVRLTGTFKYVTTTRVKAISNKVDAVGAEADAIDARLKKALTVGRSVTPVTGTTMSTASYFFANVMPEAATIKRVRGYNPQGSSKTLLIRKATSSGSASSTLATITVPSGAFDLDLVSGAGLITYPTIGKNEYIGFHPGAANSGAGPTDNSITFTSGTADSGGWYSNGQSSPTSTTGFAPGTPTTSSVLQIGFDVEYYPDINAQIATLQGQVGDSPLARFERLYNRILASQQAAAKGNPRTRGVMSSPPTVSVSASAPSSPYVAFPSSITSTASLNGLCQITGGWVGYSAGRVFPFAMTRTIGVSTGGGATNAYQGVHRFIWETTAAVHTFVFQTSKLVNLRLLVDGQYVDMTGFTATATGTDNYVTLNFGSAKYSGRRIEFEVQGGPDSGGGNALVQFKGWYKAPTDALWAPPSSPRVGIFGDSLTFGPTYSQVGASQLADGYARIIGDYLGIDDLWQSGLSGTGWLWQSGVPFPNIYQRVTDITGNAMDLAVIAMGANDLFNFGSTNSESPTVTISAATIQARVTLTLQTIRAANPNLPIIVFGPFTNASGTATTNQTAVENAISAGVAACSDKLIAFRPLISTNFINGTGKVTATTGDGIADWMRAGDGTHWTLNGHAYAGADLADEVMSGLRAIRTALAA